MTAGSGLTFAAVGEAARGQWPAILASNGIADQHLVNKHGPCPVCGGRDRYRFDNRDGRGTFYCNQCGAGDGFRLLELFTGQRKGEVLRLVANWLGMDTRSTPESRKQAAEYRMKAQRREAERELYSEILVLLMAIAPRVNKKRDVSGKPYPIEHWDREVLAARRVYALLRLCYGQ